MKHSRYFPAVLAASMSLVLVTIVLAACNRNAEPAGATSALPTAKLSTENSVALPTERASASTATSLKVTVSLSPAVANKAAPSDVVFIFARAMQGPRMPLAIVRKQVKDLPVTIVLDDSQAMSPELKLSGASEVVVVARVSKSGMASAQAGDLEAVSGPVKPGNQTVAIHIATVVGQ